MSAAPPRTAANGSATVELIVLVPFVLILLAAIWDLRAFIAYRTELARELYVVAATISDDFQGASPLESMVAQAQAKFEPTSVSGSIHAAVVVRGRERNDGTPCPDDQWCRPAVTLAWPAVPADAAGTWSRDGAAECAGRTPGSVLPAAGNHFAPTDTVLPNEGADPDGPGPETAPRPDEWVSRTMSDREWWVVVDICIEPQPGLFIGRLVNYADRMLDTRSFAWRRRAGWRSVHDLANCDWCGTL